ncbi:SDR family NAD(P)-dependent oxidoreductase [Mycobacterium sp. SMC-15]|uniref:SDR family NAD(P)-dependent oxidoreductase n=1 Tax=Mycobacterium sp. SMC-15 TaxID=3381627 RepID=UPI003875CF60
MSGTNAHVIVEQAPDVEVAAAGAPAPVSTLVVSGKSPARIAATAGVLAQWMQTDGAGVSLADVAVTLQQNRSRFKYTAGVCVRDRAAAVAGLTALAAGESAPGVIEPRPRPATSRPVFVFSGQGSHWVGMGRRLLADEPVFADAVAELEPLFARQVGFSLREVIEQGVEISGDAQVQPVIMALQLALAALWRSYGVVPDAVIGHSMGEVSAAVVAGALTPEQGLKVIGVRSALMSRQAGQGAVALLELDAAAAQELLVGYPGVEVAGYLSPRQTVVAGSPADVDAVIAAVAAAERFARRVNMEVASHTAFMDPILDELRAELADLTPQMPQIPFISTAVDPAGPTPRLDADYWVANVRKPALVSQAVTVAVAEHDTFIEISPHPLLTHSITETAEAAAAEPVTVASTLRRGDDETLSFHVQLTELGRHAGDTNAANPSQAGGFAELPTTPWQHSRHWLAPRGPATQAQDVHPLLGVHVEMLSGGDHIWQNDLSTETMPWLAEHPVHGQSVAPAAALIEMLVAAGSEALGRPTESIAVTGIQIEQPLVLERGMQVTTQLSGSEGQTRVEIHARAAGEAWSRHVVADISPAPAERDGSASQEDSAHSVLTLPDSVATHPAYRLHPALLDAGLRQLAAAISAEGISYVPTAVAAVRVFAPAGRQVGCHAEVTSHEDQVAVGRVVLSDEAGAVLAELTGIELRPLDPRSLRVPLDQKLFATEWALSPAPDAAGAADGSWLVLSEPSAGELAAQFGARLGGPNRKVVTGPFADEPALTEAVARAAADPAHPPAGIVVFLDRRGFDGSDPEGALARARELVWTASSTARAAVQGWPAATGANKPRLWLVSRGGLAFGDREPHEPADPAIGALKGVVRTWRFPGELARVLADEPDLGATLVDLDASADTAALADALLAELGAPLRDDVIAWRGGQRYTERLTRATLDGAETIQAPQAEVRADGSYLLTGGLGGLGIVVARWLVARGAGRIVLNGRSEPAEQQRAVLDELAAGTEVVFVAGDISSPGVADALVAAAQETGKPLRGVVHAAGVLGDGLVTAVTRESLESVWSAKAVGAARLHAATAATQLDWWVGFSSMAALLGLPGQLGYATSNAWLDALMAWRHASGLPATAINWGQWSDVGLGRSMTLSVLDPISPDEGIEALDAVLGADAGRIGARIGVGRLRIDRAVATSPEFRELTFFEDLVSEASEAGVTLGAAATSEQSGAAASAAGVPDWSTIPADQRHGELVVRLQAILARELRTSATAVDVDQPFPEMGLDSMIAMTVLKETQQLVGVDLSASMLWNHPSISALATHLVGLLASRYVEPDTTTGQDDDDLGFGSSGGVLDELFDQVESASTGSESGIY